MRGAAPSVGVGDQAVFFGFGPLVVARVLFCRSFLSRATLVAICVETKVTSSRLHPTKGTAR
jgi:hypothetical protein